MYFCGQISDQRIDGGNMHSIIDRALPHGYNLSNLCSVPGVAAVPNEGKVRAKES